MSDLMPDFPSRKFFLETVLPEDMNQFTEQLRTELYYLAVAYYKAGWENATDAAQSHVTELVYADFPLED